MLASSVWRGRHDIGYFNGGLVLGAVGTAMLVLLPAAVLQAVLPAWSRWLLLAAFAALCLACDAGVAGFRLPQNARLVPSTIVAARDGRGPLQFGFEMGTGMRTYLPSHLPYVAVGAAALLTPWWAAPVLGAAFGAGRAVMVWASVGSGAVSTWDAEFNARRRLLHPVEWLVVACCLAVAVGALT